MSKFSVNFVIFCYCGFQKFVSWSLLEMGRMGCRVKEVAVSTNQKVSFVLTEQLEAWII